MDKTTLSSTMHLFSSLRRRVSVIYTSLHSCCFHALLLLWLLGRKQPKECSCHWRSVAAAAVASVHDDGDPENQRDMSGI